MLDEKVTETKWVTNADIINADVDFIKQTDFDTKIMNINNKMVSNKRNKAKVENKIDGHISS